MQQEARKKGHAYTEYIYNESARTWDDLGQMLWLMFVRIYFFRASADGYMPCSDVCWG